MLFRSHRRRRPGRPPGRSDKPLCRGLTFTGAGADPPARPDCPPASREQRPQGLGRSLRQAAPVTDGARPSGRPAPFGPPVPTSSQLACGQHGHPELPAWSREALLGEHPPSLPGRLLTPDHWPGGRPPPCLAQHPQLGRPPIYTQQSRSPNTSSPELLGPGKSTKRRPNRVCAPPPSF